MTVAVKQIKSADNKTGYQDLQREIKIMKTLQHKNIVEIKGVVEGRCFGGCHSFLIITVSNEIRRLFLFFFLPRSRNATGNGICTLRFSVNLY